MKNLLKTQLSLAVVFLIFAGSSVFAQQSDYQIQQDFRADYNQLSERIDAAISTEELAEIEEELEELRNRYSEHAVLINSAIFPETFDNRVSNLQVRHSEAVAHYSRIDELNERVDELSAEMNVFRDRLAAMDQERTSLQQEIERAETSERRQASLIRQYRQNIEQRDSFVSDFLHELLSKYQRMDESTQLEVAEAAERLDENPVDMLRTIIAEYINAADQSPGLQTPDYVAMRAQHGYFSEVWDRIGESLSNTFAPDNPVETRQEISDMIAAWLASVDNKLWNSITTAFNQNGIELSSFTSPDEFNRALNDYVDSAYALSLESNNEADYDVFRNFRDFWNNTVKSEWGEALITGNILSSSQMAAIDIKLNNWGEAATPTSNLMFILFLVSLAVIVGLVVLLITRKK